MWGKGGVLLSVLFVGVSSIPPPWAFNGEVGRSLLSQLPPAVAPTGLMTQLVDHNNANSPTFQQRWWANDSVWDQKGPIILDISGEGPCRGVPFGYEVELMERYKALYLTLEHRYYGESLPFGGVEGLSNENIVYLTVEQVMGDLAMFVLSQNERLKLAAGHPWLIIGGSYSGALSSWFRTAHRELSVAAISSSGVVLPLLKFPEFDESIATAAGEVCADVLRNTTAAFERADATGKGDHVRSLMGFPTGPGRLKGDFYYMLADGAAMAVQYGHKEALCQQLHPSTDDDTLVEQFARVIEKIWGKDFGSTCFYDTVCLTTDKTKWQPTNRAWRWQKCAELAYFQVAPKVGSLRSQEVSLDYHLEQCTAVFGKPMMPDVERIVKAFGGDRPDTLGVTNVFYSQGSDDPWQWAGIRQSLGPSLPEDTAVCDGCGHCGDLADPTEKPSSAVAAQRKMELSHLDAWLSQ